MPLLGIFEKPISMSKYFTYNEKISSNKISKTKTIIALITMISISSPSFSNENNIILKQQNWNFNGIMGKFDQNSLRRGFQVYREVCATCHSMNLLSFRNLSGTIGYSEDIIKAFANECEVIDGPNDEGEMFERPGKSSDKFPKPYPNEQAARASNNGAYPVDLSLVIEARTDGPNYLFSLLTGYERCPDNFQLYPGMYYNIYFPGNQIAMPPPISDNIVEYQDGTIATIEQVAHDITEFLVWAANPHMEERKSIGLKVIMFLIIFSGLMFVVNKKVWAKIKKNNY
jgi:ubiquinol-cytochrome c reductase cytochrome c1 subunit